MADLIDPTQTGNYPVVLGDSILGKTSNDIFTGIRCTYLFAPILGAPVEGFILPGNNGSLTHLAQIITNHHNPAANRVDPLVSSLRFMAKRAHTTCRLPTKTADPNMPTLGLVTRQMVNMFFTSTRTGKSLCSIVSTRPST